MSQQIDSFCEKLRGRLNEMDNRLQQLKGSTKAGSEKARQDLHSQAEKLRASLNADRSSIEAAKTRMNDWAAGTKATFDEKVAQWKAATQAGAAQESRRGRGGIRFRRIRRRCRCGRRCL